MYPDIRVHIGKEMCDELTLGTMEADKFLHVFSLNKRLRRAGDAIQSVSTHENWVSQ